MAHKAVVCGMVSEIRTAGRAVECIAAFCAGDCRTASAAVYKEDRLLAGPEIFLQFGTQSRAKRPAVSASEFRFHICDDNARHRLLIIAFVHAEKLILPAHGTIHTLHRGSCGAQQKQCILLNTQEFGHITGMITGIIFGFIGIFLLLIHDEQTKSLHRSKHGRAGPDHHIHKSGSDAFPLVIPLTDGQ